MQPHTRISLLPRMKNITYGEQHRLTAMKTTPIAAKSCSLKVQQLKLSWQYHAQKKIYIPHFFDQSGIAYHPLYIVCLIPN